jgi:hypothetical protein
MNFINIGVGVDARKFILQAVGRGVRIEPIENKRKRLLPLHNANEVDAGLFGRVIDKVAPLEALVIFGTNRQALKTVIQHLDQESRKRDFHQLSLFKNKAAEQHELLIPVYKMAEKPIIEHEGGARFEIETNELELFKKYVNYIGDNRVLLAMYDAEPQKIGLLTDSVSQTDRFYKKSERAYRSIDLLVRRILDYFSVVPQEFERLKKLEEEINHFRSIRVSLKDISDLAGKIELVHQFEDPEAIKMKLRERLERKEIDLDQYTAGIEKAARMVKEAPAEYEGKRLKIRHVANHYYIPIILSGETERIDYIKHIIQEDSEIKFLNRLEECLTRPSNRFQDFDWWLFSKLDENLDEVYIPYYDGSSNKVREFKPDFIFWLERGNTYFIVFIDPKGTVHTDYERKIEGYSQIFESSGRPKTIAYGGKEAKVFAFLYTDDVDRLSKGYKRYWFDHIDKALASVKSAP